MTSIHKYIKDKKKTYYKRNKRYDEGIAFSTTSSRG